MSSNENQDRSIPKTHPRYKSLKYRHRIIGGIKNLVVTEAGLIAHGRGECFDYILGERTTDSAKKAINAAVAALLLAEKPVISVNGNVAALIPKKLVKLSKILDVPLEINLFYNKEGRVEAIKNILHTVGANKVYGVDEKKIVELEGLESHRRKVELIANADLVMVPLEDGDRTEKLKKLNKKIIAIDLNPLSRTALWADITIVDNIVRVIPEMITTSKELKKLSDTQLNDIVQSFDNKINIQNTIELIIQYLEIQKKNAFDIVKF